MLKIGFIFIMNPSECPMQIRKRNLFQLNTVNLVKRKRLNSVSLNFAFFMVMHDLNIAFHINSTKVLLILLPDKFYKNVLFFFKRLNKFSLSTSIAVVVLKS